MLPYSCLVHNEDGNLCSLCYNSVFNFLAFVTEANFIWLATSSSVSLCLIATSSIHKHPQDDLSLFALQ